MKYRKATKKYDDRLKPCPFCGEKLFIDENRSLREYQHPNNDCFLAEADSEYGAIWIDTNDKDSIKKWNTRVSLQKQF